MSVFENDVFYSPRSSVSPRSATPVNVVLMPVPFLMAYPVAYEAPLILPRAAPPAVLAPTVRRPRRKAAAKQRASAPRRLSLTASTAASSVSASEAECPPERSKAQTIEEYQPFTKFSYLLINNVKPQSQNYLFSYALNYFE